MKVVVAVKFINGSHVYVYIYIYGINFKGCDEFG